MSQLGTDLIKDCTDRILLAFKEDRFTEEEMRLILKWFENVVDVTKKTIERGPSK